MYSSPLISGRNYREVSRISTESPYCPDIEILFLLLCLNMDVLVSELISGTGYNLHLNFCVEHLSSGRLFVLTRSINLIDIG